MDVIPMILAVSAGLALAASCGFRIFIPPLVMSLAAHLGYLDLAEDLSWLASYPAVIVLGVATFGEILAYYIPWFDNLLDSVATPVASLAGILVAAASFGEMDPVLKWSLALIAGGGGAGVVQLGTAAVRGASTFTTGGIGNPAVATGENVAAATISVMAIIIPIIGIILFGTAVVLVIRHIRTKRRSTTPENETLDSV